MKIFLWSPIQPELSTLAFSKRLLLSLLTLFIASCSSGGDDPVRLGDDASLSSLSISGVTLDPEFSSSVTDYTAAVRFSSKSTLVTASTADVNSTVNVNGNLVASGSVSDPIALDEGDNTITVNVTAEDKTTRQTYTIAVDRQSASEFEFTQKYLGVPWFAKDAELWIGYQLALSADGETLVAGDPEIGNRTNGDDPDEFPPWPEYAGVAHVLTRDGAGYWGRRANVTNAEANDYFGAYTALSEDGSTLAVGAPWEDSAATGVNGDQSNNDAPGSGAVYVYVRDNAGGWTEETYIKASNTDAGDLFGGLALSGDGATLVVRAIYEASAATGVNGDETDNSAPRSGAVYILTRHSGGVWTQQAYLKASGTGADFELFGRSVAISQDGDTLAVGGYHGGSYAVYVFTRDGGNIWGQQAVVKNFQSDALDFFGRRVALSEDGNTLAVGAYGEDSAAIGVNGDQSNNDAPDSGTVYVYVRDNAGTWTQQAYIKASNTDASDHFGRSISLSADGSMLIVGSEGEGSAATGVNGDDTDNSATGSGAVYVFTRDTSEAWTQRAYIKPSTSEPNQYFGSRVAVSGDGTILVVDAERDIGAIYFFEL